ncbi:MULTISPECIES: CBS domain-containing protein [Nocardiopsidaceae]|jgi:CBS domain-containing protein|uniref:CBS domain-containing protein n=1 Tax=Streptomonospora nanhaiensis TaxID=1323731 RepID=A0ABY6YGT6_9ACTN|nr:CBS domain-containing protein [Streptomonospora nanhaiensis]WAE71429.1 CBS domain-containing protein [Streptomonospora nanhaiensis]
MADSIAEVMSETVHTVAPETTLREAARIMRDEDVGDVVVTDSGRIRGVLTDRDIVVRCVADEGDPDRVTVGQVCSAEVVTVPRQSSLRDAVHAMRASSVRRLPVVDGPEVVGIVTMGDLARVVDEDSALADVSAAPPNR